MSCQQPTLQCWRCHRQLRRCMSTNCWTWFHESGQQDQKLQSSYSQACDAVPISRFGFTNGITYSMRHFVSSGLVRVSWVMPLMGAISLPTLARRGACHSALVPNCLRSPPPRRPACKVSVGRCAQLPTLHRCRDHVALRAPVRYYQWPRRFCHPLLAAGLSKHQTQLCPFPREEAKVPTPGSERPLRNRHFIRPTPKSVRKKDALS